jgi:hypothetical protein
VVRRSVPTDYAEDSSADTGERGNACSGGFVEIQGTAERDAFADEY